MACLEKVSFQFLSLRHHPVANGSQARFCREKRRGICSTLRPPLHLETHLDERLIETISRDFASEISQARAVIASDPDGAVSLLNWPIRELREAIIAERRRRQAQAALRGHSSAQMYGSLVRDDPIHGFFSL
jgi:hypothetical protein